MNRQVDTHLTKEARSRNQEEEEFKEDGFKKYDPEDDAFNDRDKQELKLYRSHSRHVTKGKQKLSVKS